MGSRRNKLVMLGRQQVVKLGGQLGVQPGGRLGECIPEVGPAGVLISRRNGLHDQVREEAERKPPVLYDGNFVVFHQLCSRFSRSAKVCPTHLQRSGNPIVLRAGGGVRDTACRWKRASSWVPWWRHQNVRNLRRKFVWLGLQKKLGVKHNDAACRRATLGRRRS